MSVELRVQGAAKLGALSKRLKDAGDRGLQKELRAGIRSAVKPALRDVAEHARAILPQENGVNEVVAATKFTISVRGGARNPGVRVKARAGSSDLDAIDRGRLRHPVYGNRRVWVTQAVRPGWFTTPMDNAGPHLVKELNAVIDRVAAQIGIE